jgi:hypothetical protein
VTIVIGELGIRVHREVIIHPPARLPSPGVAIYTSPQGGRPWIAVSNRWHRELVAFTFLPAEGFREVSRTRASDDAMEFYSSPTILPNMNTAVGTNKGVMFGGPSASPAAAITNLGRVFAQPTLAAGNRVMVVGENSLAVLQNNAVVVQHNLRAQPPPQSMARAGASGTHVFVSTTNGLHTFDANGQNKLFTLPWHGGISSPAIGPQGHVYVMDDSNGLYVFPPPTERERQDIGRGLQI